MIVHYLDKVTLVVFAPEHFDQVEGTYLLFHLMYGGTLNLNSFPIFFPKLIVQYQSKGYEGIEGSLSFTLIYDFALLMIEK